MSESILYLMRHAEVEARYHRVFGGRIDMDLSPNGREQAQALARFLHDHHLEALVASPMKRARQSIDPIAQATGLIPTFCDGLREVDFGDWTGLKWEQVEETFKQSAFDWLHLLDQAGIPNAESTADWTSRVGQALLQILERHPGKRIGILCHGGTVRVLLSLLLDIPLVRTAAFEVEYASVTCVEHRPHKARLHFLNMTPWRDLP